MNPPNLYASAHTPPASAPYLAPGALPAEGPPEPGGAIPPIVRDVVMALWRGKWLIVLAALAAGAFTVARILPTPRTYTSTSSFVLHGSRGAGATGLAAQLGISLGGGDGPGSPSYFTELLHTREILGRVAADSFCDPCGEGRPRAPLTTILGLQGLDSLRRTDAAVRRLRGAIRPAISRTGIITLYVTMPSPSLAQQVAEAALHEVSRFNVESQQSQAAAERRFTEQRMGEVQRELRSAEAQLLAFLQTNRIASSPELEIRRGRLEQEVELRRQLYLTLARAYEQAKIDEVRDTPILTVLDRPSYALLPDGRGLVARTAFSLVYGGLAGVALVLALFLYQLRRRRTA